MAQYQWRDEVVDLDELQKVLKTLTKSTANKPDRDVYTRNRDAIQQARFNKQLEAAQVQSQMNGFKAKKKELQVIVDEHFSTLNQANSKFRERKTEARSLNDEKNKVFDGAKIRNPHDKLREVKQNINQLKYQLQAETLNHRMETKIIRDIRDEEEMAESIEAYIQSDAAKHWENYDAKKTEVRAEEGKLNAIRKNTEGAVKQRDAIIEDIQELEASHKEIAENIKQLSVDMQDLNTNHITRQKDYSRAMAEKAALEAEIDTRKRNTKKRKVIRKSRQEVLQRQEKEAEKKRQQKEKKDAAEAEELQKKKERCELKRQRAMAAYVQMQKKVKETKPVAVASTSSGKRAPKLKAGDPHRQEKALCHSLIVLCESMKPKKSSRKRKKKARLVYRADAFSKFSKVGVKLPKNASDIDTTIEALHAKIRSYDEEVVEEPEAVVAVEEDVKPEEPQAETTEVVKTEENAEEAQI